jgi:hypothetical protein
VVYIVTAVALNGFKRRRAVTFSLLPFCSESFGFQSWRQIHIVTWRTQCSEPVNDLTIYNHRGCSNTCNFLFKLHATLRQAITDDEKWNCGHQMDTCARCFEVTELRCVHGRTDRGVTPGYSPLCVYVRTTVVWDATPCRLEEVYRPFRGRVSQARDQSSFVCCMLGLSFDPEDGGSIVIRNTGNILAWRHIKAGSALDNH